MSGLLADIFVAGDRAKKRVKGLLDPQTYQNAMDYSTFEPLTQQQLAEGLLGGGVIGSVKGIKPALRSYDELAKLVDQLSDAWSKSPSQANWAALEQARAKLNPMMTREAEVSMANQMLGTTPIENVLENIFMSSQMSGVPGPNLLKQIKALRNQGVTSSPEIRQYLSSALEKSPNNYEVASELKFWK